MTIEEKNSLALRAAQPEDLGEVLRWINKLAAHEGRPHAVTASEESLSEWLFTRRAAEVLLADYRGTAAGFAIVYPIFSSFAGKGFLYLEDLYLDDALRGLGLGRVLMQKIAAIAAGRGYAGLKWTCLPSNESGLQFYRALGFSGHSSVAFLIDGDAFQSLLPELD